MNRVKILNIILVVGIIINIILASCVEHRKTFDLDLKSLILKKDVTWQSEDCVISDYLINAVGTDSEVWRHYYDENGNILEVWAAFYKDQTKSTAHNPNTCYDGQGWSTEKRTGFLILDDGRKLNISRMILEKGNEKRLTYYWYVAAGQYAGSEFTKNLYKFVYGFLKNRSDLLFIRISTDVSDNGIQRKEDLLRSFIKSFLPTLESRLPASYLQF